MTDQAIRVSTQGKYGVLVGPRSPRLFDTARMLPDKKRWKNGVLNFELTSSNIEFLVDRHPHAVWEGGAKDALEKVRNLREAEKMVISQKASGEVEDVDFPFKKKPFDHQLKVFSISRDKSNFGLFMEMGTGKTKIVIDTIAHLFMTGEIDSVLIFAINGVHTQWVDEQLPEHMPEHIQYQALTFHSGWGKKKKQEFENFLESGGLRIFSMHTESMSHKSATEYADAFLSKGRSLVVVDESSLIKNPKALRTKNILKLRERGAYRRILSGTPINKGVEDLYSQLMFLDQDILGYKSYYTFRNHFCIMGGFEDKQIVDYKNMEELQSRVDGHTFRVLKKDCLDLPEKLFVSRYVEMTPQQQETYHRLRKEFLVELDGVSMELTLAVTRLLRLQQILCGHLPADEGGVIDIPNNRVKSLVDAVNEIDGKVIVWARFRYDGVAIAKALKEAGIKFVVYGAGTPQDQRSQSIETFREDPTCKVFLANPQVGGMGLNLTVASTCIYYSLTFSLENFLQSQDRIHRIGQTSPCTYLTMEVPKSIDTKIIRNLKAKKGIADTVLDIREIMEGP